MRDSDVTQTRTGGSKLIDQAAKFMRFAAVGAGCGAIYAAVTLLLTAYGGWTAGPASVIGYIAAVPLSFFGQRSFAFRAGGPSGGQFLRFGLTTVFNIALSYAVMEASHRWLGIGIIGGIVLTIMSIPIVTFFVLDNWVFKERANNRLNGS